MKISVSKREKEDLIIVVGNRMASLGLCKYQDITGGKKVKEVVEEALGYLEINEED